MASIGAIAELWRYPVKSMGGEPCEVLSLDSLGVAGDRRFAFESSDAPPGKPLLGSLGRSAMLRFSAATDRDGLVRVRAPDGASVAIDSPDLLRRFNALLPPSATLTLLHRDRPFTDVRPIAIHSLGAIRALARELGVDFDARRLRSNLIFDLGADEAFLEDRLQGRTLRLGKTAEIQITERIPRCRMVSLEPATADPDPSLLRHLARYHEGRAGIYARCTVSGEVRVGDPLTVVC